jgi:hypothetical protein
MAVIPGCSDISKIGYHERSAYWLAITAAPPDLPTADPNVSQRKDITLFEQSPIEATELHERSGTVVHYLGMTNHASLPTRNGDNHLNLWFRPTVTSYNCTALCQATLLWPEGGRDTIKTPFDPKETYLIIASIKHCRHLFWYLSVISHAIMIL